MDPIDLTVYVDTNCFIELRDIKDLPWKDIAPGANRIEVAVPRIVITELDRMKSDRSSDRRRNRSRSALKLITAAIDAENERIRLSDSTVQLTFRICTSSNLPWDDHPNLDRHSPDDSVVLCALAEQGIGDKVLLTLDRGPYLSAKLAGLRALTPHDSWKITAEESGESEEIAKLRRQLAECRATRPEIDASFIREGKSFNVFEFTTLRVSQLSKDVQETLLNDIHDFHYEEALNDEGFVDRVRKYLAGLHHAVFAASNTNEIAFQIINSSSVTAHNLLSQMTVRDGFRLIGDKDEFERIQNGLELPRPEKPRSPTFGLEYPILRPPVEKPRDPTKFYWQERPGYQATFSSKICQEFRARQEFIGEFWISASSKASISGPAELEVSATNLPGPVRRTVGLRVTTKETSWGDEEVLKLLPDLITKRLSGSY